MQRGDRTRDAVIAAATERFTRDGFDGTTTAEIAADAGVSEATVFGHFDSKAGLLVAVMRAHYEELAADVSAVADRPAAPAERLARLVHHWFRRMDEDWQLVRVFAQHGRYEADGVIGEAFRECNRSITRIMSRVIEDLKSAGAIREDVPTRLLRDAVFGTIEHTIIRRLATGRPRSLKRTGDELLTLLLHGASPPASPPASAAAGTDGPDLAAIDAKLDTLLDRLA